MDKLQEGIDNFAGGWVGACVRGAARRRWSPHRTPMPPARAPTRPPQPDPAADQRKLEEMIGKAMEKVEQ